MPTEINNPSISNTRAIVTTNWGKRGYRPITVRTIESYFVETALDNDSDTWQLEFGDPTGRWLDLFKRDNEIRVQIFGIGRTGARFIMTGVADEGTYDEQGSIALTGRDFSSLAVDSTVPPKQYRKKTGWSIVEQQAKEIGFVRRQLSKKGKMHNVLYTDGSESYWEFWYRLYRKDQQFLWCEPSGLLIADSLNYSDDPSYFFGTPRKTEPKRIADHYLPIERLEIHKSTQKRIGEVWVFGQKGEIGFLEKVSDPATRAWIKKPRKVMLDASASSPKTARKTAHEEIFDGKVGSIELSVTIADPGFIIRQNQIARLSVPEIGLEGEYFIVGSRIQCGLTGFLQEIRLREKLFAVPRRIPDDPKLVSHRGPNTTSTLTSLGGQISGLADMPAQWGDYFVKAAKEHHGPWDFDLFLATLIGICSVEGNFKNVREYATAPGPEWFPPPTKGASQEAHRHGEPIPDPVITLSEWKGYFANSASNPLNPFRGTRGNAEAGVGPMQLTSIGLKEMADDHFMPKRRDEYIGGRWHPEHNIWVSAKYLRNNLKSVVADSGRDVDIWMGVSAYNKGAGGARPNDPYAIGIKNRVLHNPGYLANVTAAVQAAREASKAAQDGQTDPWMDDAPFPSGLPTREQCLEFYNRYAFPGFAKTILTKRQAIVCAAMWGKFNRDKMTYSHSQSKDLGPPPNVPELADCSWFAHWCYTAAGVRSPGTWTSPQWAAGTPISYAAIAPGDLIFYGNPNSKDGGHVAVYVGYGKVVSFGTPGGPWMVDVKYRVDLAGFRRYPL